ncbi:hypothetical protein FACS1894166_06410 [Bacilli bacterium]|nr:hypothetical protein FACS1894166_06410 [Bacilli bacterium]
MMETKIKLKKIIAKNCATKAAPMHDQPIAATEAASTQACKTDVQLTVIILDKYHLRQLI